MNIVHDPSYNSIRSNSSIRASQEIQINQERINNLRISSASDICMVIIFMAGLGIVTYYVVVTLHGK